MKRNLKAVFLVFLSLFLTSTVAFAADVDASKEGIVVPVPDELIEYGEGMWKVGADIPASAYFCVAAPGAIVSAVSIKDGSGSDANILAFDTFGTHSIIGLQDGEYVEVMGCTLMDMGFTGEYLQVLGEAHMAEHGEEMLYIPEGMYLAGYHIAPGEYRTTPIEGAIVSALTIYADAAQRDIEDFSVLQGPGYVTIQEGQFVKLMGVTMELAE